MPRIRKPTAVAKAEGLYAKNGTLARREAAEIKPLGEIGSPPKHLTKEERAIWKEILGRAHPGVIARGDELMLENLVMLVAEFRVKRYAFTKHTQMATALAHFGMTPSARSGMNDTGPQKPKAPSGFGALRKRG